MRLTERSDYALRVLMYLAARKQRAMVREMAGRFGVSPHHLAKVVQSLVAIGLVQTISGRGGGVQLARDPSEIRVGDVIRQMEPDTALVECLRADSACPLHGPCRLTGLLKIALDSFFETLNHSTLADLARPSTKLLRSVGVTLGSTNRN